MGHSQMGHSQKGCLRMGHSCKGCSWQAFGAFTKRSFVNGAFVTSFAKGHL